MKKLLAIIPIFVFANYYNIGLKAYLNKNYNTAKKYFKLACIKEKNAWGCFSYAQLINNPQTKEEYIQKACKLGLKPACKK